MNRKRQKSEKAWSGSSEGEAQGDKESGVELFMASEINKSQESTSQIMEEVCQPKNLLEALRRVKQNRGSPGVDGMTVKELPGYLQKNWTKIREQLLGATYKPQLVRRVEIPKSDGGKRQLGIPTVIDRLIQQSLLQVLQRRWDHEFSQHSHGFRPGRNAHGAIKEAKKYVEEGYQYVVDIDLEKFFDRVNHDKLMSYVGARIRDKRVMKLIGMYLRAGAVMGEGVTVAREEGTPQGGPLSPLLSNLYLDELDKELERRGHRFVRYADDCNIYVKSERAGQRVKENVRRWIEKKLKLKVNENKSAVDQVTKRKFLGFSFMIIKGEVKVLIARNSLRRFKGEIRRLTYRTRGLGISRIINVLNRYLRGWLGYYGICQIPGLFKQLDGWIRRRLRAIIWKQWKSCQRRRKGLINRGINKQKAAKAAGSSKGAWRMSHTQAMDVAFPLIYFREIGLQSLVT